MIDEWYLLLLSKACPKRNRFRNVRFLSPSRTPLAVAPGGDDGDSAEWRVRDGRARTASITRVVRTRSAYTPAAAYAVESDFRFDLIHHN
ncbi:hypothetical protein EVAR_94283_1 [Eumeta japonica]|uniref:Uncharacterized protein n=1 Tax=Eumeta variegata TaxID=151549 RepID=A0A4C1UF74_EUMVA|nr:hypothetical protein EVAR_94283_1 [Eumeta japonica]